MKKTIALFLSLSLLLSLLLCGCTAPSPLERGRWDGQVYYTAYGDFNLRSNELFERYTDKQIKKDLGYVYSKNGQVLNDVVLSSDYCAICITLEIPGEEHSLKEYVNAYIQNTTTSNPKGSFTISDTYYQDIAGSVYTAVPVLYYTQSQNNLVGYCEYAFIKKAENNVFVVIRITSTTQLNVEIALKMFEDPSPAPEKQTAETTENK
jgi:hypothetical protein